MDTLLKDYSWDMGGYSFRTSQAERGKLTLNDAYLAYQLVPGLAQIDQESEPEDYIRKAQATHALKYVFFYLDHNEKYFNDRINTFLLSESDQIAPERFMDLKLECRAEVLRRFAAFDTERGNTFLTYIHRYITDVLLQFRMGEEYMTFSSLQEYKDARRLMQLYQACSGDVKETIRQFVLLDGCSEKIAAEKLAAAYGQRNRFLPARSEEEDAERQTDEELYAYHEPLYPHSDTAQVQRALASLSYNDRLLLEKYNAICMRCGLARPMRERMSFESMTALIEGTSASGTERAYKRALERLTLELVTRGVLHCVRIRQKSIEHKGRKTTAAVYEYQVDNGGAWGEIQFDLAAGTAWVETFAEKDTFTSWQMTDLAIDAVLHAESGKLPKEKLIPCHTAFC